MMSNQDRNTGPSLYVDTDLPTLVRAQRGHSANEIDPKKVNIPANPGYSQLFDAGQNGCSVRYLREKGA